MNPLLTFLKSEHGGLIVEFAVWMPFILLVIAFAIDGVFLMAQNAKLNVVSRDIIRHIGTGQGGNYATASTSNCHSVLISAAREVFPGIPAAEFDCTVWRGAAGTDEEDLVRVTLSVPMGRVMMFGSFFGPSQQLTTRGIGFIQEPAA